MKRKNNISVSWSEAEVLIIVSDYFNMLTFELKGEKYSKAEHRRRILPFLDSRSEGSVEFKHQNISAVLVELGQPFIKGYLPLYNYQQILKEAVIKYLNQNNDIEKHFDYFATKDIIIEHTETDYSKFLVNPPEMKFINEPIVSYEHNPIKVNYLQKEQNNYRLGLIGEELALDYERRELILLGKEGLAEQIRWVSQEDGDGAGFDILSKNLNGTDKYIEVKSTKLSKETPFYFSRNELEFSIGHESNYHLYRLFNIGDLPKMFIKQGSLNKICHSTAMSYKGYF